MNNSLRKILVTGSSSFLGHHVIPKLIKFAKNNEFEVLTPSSTELDLLDSNNVLNYIKENNPDTILHMAARCGGIGANKKNPAIFLHSNLKMMSNIFDAILATNSVTHFYGLGSVCAYPKLCPIPFKEKNLWNGKPESTNFPYGESKRVMLLMQQSYRAQFGLKGAHLIPVNMFGEYDHFDLNNSHVIPALINKFIQAKNNNQEYVEIWGDGSSTREFLYAGDCADAICKAILKRLDFNAPINIGTGKEISIIDLAYLIKDLIKYDGFIVSSGDKSVNGQPKRCLDVSRAKKILNFQATTSLEDGLKKTINWYYKNISLNSTKEISCLINDLNYKINGNILPADYLNHNSSIYFTPTVPEISYKEKIKQQKLSSFKSVLSKYLTYDMDKVEELLDTNKLKEKKEFHKKYNKKFIELEDKLFKSQSNNIISNFKTFYQSLKNKIFKGY